MFSNKIKASLIALTAFAMMAPAAFAETGTTNTTVTVTGSGYGITAPASVSFGTVAISGYGAAGYADFSEIWTADMTGTGAGWHVTVGASQFTDGSHTLPVGSLNMLAPHSVAFDAGGGGGDPTIVSPDSWLTGIDGTPARIVTAAAGQGMSSWFVRWDKENQAGTGDLMFSAQPGIYAGNYHSTLTFTITTAP